ncbi:hypothetical protein [uncultured Bacteroides sp.]|uniref:hypothetical protein n=1 Tax=uncultured Bacteroides sp. TaxID=162156 RepID=UPI003426B5F8
MQRFRLQAPQVVIHVRGKRHLRPSQRMLDLGESVRMVIAVSVCFRPAVLPACRVRMRHRQRLVRKGIDRGCHVVAAQNIALHGLHLASLYVVVMGDIKLITAARYRYNAAGQFPLAVARGVKGELSGGEARTAHKAVVVVVVLYVYHRVGRGILPGAFPLLCQPSESVVQVVRPLGSALRALVAVLREGQHPGSVVRIFHVLRTRQLLVDAPPLPVIPVLKRVLFQITATLVHRLQHKPQVTPIVID